MAEFCHGERRDIMKAGIHPEYKDTKFICACGETFTAKSTRDEYHVEICSKCHPFYSGKQARTAHTGNIDKFNKKYSLKDKA